MSTQIFNLDFANPSLDMPLAGGSVATTERFHRLAWGTGLEMEKYPVRSVVHCHLACSTYFSSEYTGGVRNLGSVLLSLRGQGNLQSARFPFGLEYEKLFFCGRWQGWQALPVVYRYRLPCRKQGNLSKAQLLNSAHEAW